MTPTTARAAAAIEVCGLTVRYGEQPVLQDVDLIVQPGVVYALLGPNGAGKTTLINVLSTLVRPDSGTATVDGHDVVREADAVRASISTTGQFAAVDELLTARENLVLMARLNHLDRAEARRRADQLLGHFDLTDVQDRPVRTFSGGMRRRLDIAVGLVRVPPVVFLDEPTTGLDPRSRQAMWDVVRSLVAQGVTVLLTTQYLEEAEQLADRIGVLDGGRIVAEGTGAELKARVSPQRLDLHLADAGSYVVAADRLDGRAIHHDPALLIIGLPTDSGADDVRDLLNDLAAQGARVDRLSIHTATLDDVFFRLTGRAGTDHLETSGATR
ncbi:ATP-binding cassette domain-containing protein [Angustibacter sp. McL0619]|uniref:ATP-binding cassette domain-containing protein n=1 Tax=Angustibacter sp. McL0619 TaxID=3415676 RepID=UPI003CEAB4BE